MHYNPCGAAVDWARKTYKTKCRFFADDGTEIDIAWYMVPDDAPQLPYPSLIQNLQWSGHPWLAKVGEVWGAKRSWVPGPPKRGAHGNPVCGKREDFTTGGHFDPDAPDAIYDEQGLPLCCKVPAVAKLGPQVRLELPEPIPPLTLAPACGDAEFYTIGLWYTTVVEPYVDNPDGFQHTYGWADMVPAINDPGVEFALEFDGPLPAGVTAYLREGGCDVFLYLLCSFGTGQACRSGLAHGYGRLKVNIQNNTAAPVVLRWRVKLGPC